jgi:hypothetical protein
MLVNGRNSKSDAVSLEGGASRRTLEQLVDPRSSVNGLSLTGSPGFRAMRFKERPSLHRSELPLRGSALDLPRIDAIAGAPWVTSFAGYPRRQPIHQPAYRPDTVEPAPGQPGSCAIRIRVLPRTRIRGEFPHQQHEQQAAHSEHVGATPTDASPYHRSLAGDASFRSPKESQLRERGHSIAESVFFDDLAYRRGVLLRANVLWPGTVPLVLNYRYCDANDTLRFLLANVSRDWRCRLF